VLARGEAAVTPRDGGRQKDGSDQEAGAQKPTRQARLRAAW